MKFIVSSTLLLKHLQTIGGVVNNTTTMPILSNFLFEIKDGKLIVSASDLETNITAFIDVETSSQGAFSVSAKLLLETLKTFSQQPLTFIAEENNTLEIVSSQGKYSIAYVSGEDFPKPIDMSSSQKISLSANILAAAINNTIFAVGNDELRPAMNGVFFKFDKDGLTFVSTDSHKLVKYKRSDVFIENQDTFIMPKKALILLKNILESDCENVFVEYNERNAKFSFDNIELTCRLVDGQYPNYEVVFPEESPNELILNREMFLSSIRRISIFANHTTYQVYMKITGAELNISAEDLDFSNKAQERLTANYTGDDMEIALNSRHLAEMLNNLNSEEVSIKMSYKNKPCILSPVDRLEEGEEITMVLTSLMV